METFSPELRLLVASARTSGTDAVTIRELLASGIEWTCFARKATEHGVACICGSTLARVAPDLVPEDVLDAFRIIVERTRTSNRAALDRLIELNETLTRRGIDVIALKGPVFAIQAFGDLGLRVSGRCDFLVRESDAASVSATMQAAEAAGEVAANVCTALTSRKMTLDISYADLWHRARRMDLNGHLMPTPAPEDCLLVLAIHGTEQMWWRIKWACDVAAFISSHSDLDWRATIARAREMGCVRMLTLALSLARRYFGSELPQTAVERANPMIEAFVQRIATYWQDDAAPRRATPSSADLLRLHNGAMRQARHVARTLVLPRWHSAISRPVRRRLEYLPTRIGRPIGKPSLRADRHDQTGRVTNGSEAEREPNLADHRTEPDNAAAWIEYATTLFDSKRYAEAVEASDNALRVDPVNVEARHLGVFARLKSCDWRRLEDDRRWIAEGVKTHPQTIWPSLPQLFDYANDPELERLALDQIPASGHAQLPEPLWRGERYHHPEIRLAYISAGLASDPQAALATGIIECHDKERFELTAVSLGADRTTPMRRRIEAACRRFIQADAMNNAEIAATIRKLQVDIAVDLNGYTGKRNAAIMAFRSAPVQVNYPGYPGTLALPYLDYIIADRIVIPPEHQHRFSEKVVYLPHSYQPNDCRRPTAEKTPSRAAEGLPAAGFVFACFNNPYKITPAIFDIWMRLLQRVEDSVLWLLEDNVSATMNLRREAGARGIDPARLVFAPRVAPAENLARQRLADLFLDTLPMNAHATASDALWVGLPVLTCIGDIFRSRVAASVLRAVGLPELVTTSRAEYEELALALAHDASRLNAIRAKLAQSRTSQPLFDTPRYTKHLEAAYTFMWRRSRMGLPPTAFAVDAGLPGRSP